MNEISLEEILICEKVCREIIMSSIPDCYSRAQFKDTIIDLMQAEKKYIIRLEKQIAFYDFVYIFDNMYSSHTLIHDNWKFIYSDIGYNPLVEWYEGFYWEDRISDCCTTPCEVCRDLEKFHNDMAILKLHF